MATKYDGRIDKLEQKISKAGQLPKSACGPFPIWREADSTDEDIRQAKERKKKSLLEQFGTWKGAEFVVLSWGTPESTI